MQNQWGLWHGWQNMISPCHCSLHENCLRKLNLFQRKQGIPEAYVITQAQTSTVYAAHPDPSREEWWKEKKEAHMVYKLPLLPTQHHFRWLSVFPGCWWWSLSPCTLRWSNRDFSVVGVVHLKQNLLIPQHKVHVEQLEVTVMTHHHYQMKAQTPSLTSFGVWPHTPWHHKTSRAWTRGLSLKAEPLQLFRSFRNNIIQISLQILNTFQVAFATVLIVCRWEVNCREEWGGSNFISPPPPPKK